MDRATVDQPKTNIIIEQIREESNRFHGISLETTKAIVGQQHIVDAILIAILCDGHVLLEGVPGVAKTTIINTIAKTLGLTFNRIQFTPDLLPADIIGVPIYNQKRGEFETKCGPIFANLILADEINRAPAKVQSALLEAMQEQQVTIGSDTLQLNRPFLVFATQNPIEQEGTYRLPEAQLDRFMFKVQIDYPTKEQEREIIHKIDHPPVEQILCAQDIQTAQKLVKDIYVDKKIVDYILDIVFSTRSPQTYNLHKEACYISYGVSPRATLALYHTAQARAFLKKRHFVIPDDVKYVCKSILRHRMVLTYEAEADGITVDELIESILNKVASP